MAGSLTTILLNKSLTSMVKGIRANKDRGEAEYIQSCLAEIKNELQSGYADVKTMALRKLIYLQMVGYDMSWASFRVIEVMSASWFGHKRVGYLGAALSFTKDTDVILLATHLFRKSFTQNVSTDSATTEGLKYETGAALSCLANICTPDLAQDLLSDLYGMMNSTQPYLRKKATLVLLKVFQQWPKALRLSFDRLKEKLNDENQGVVSAAVYVICELAAKNPKNYLALAPQFFKILTTSSNNWVLIKVVKLLGSLVPLEPRLAKKLTEPLTDIINTTPAKSLLYECVNTLLSGELKSKTVIRLCLDKLKTFIEDADQNLKYLGLLGLHKLMRAHPVVVSEHKDLILDCLKDDDVTIRQRALDLVTSMVSKRNIAGIVRRLIEHLNTSDGAYREHVLERIIHICSQENFAYVHDFEWYLTTLVQLTELSGVSRANAARIKQQLMDVVIRVPAVRRFGVRAMSDLLLGNRLLSSDNANTNAMSEVLYACAWGVGEFAEYVTDHLELLQMMLKPTVAALPPHCQIVFVQSVLKVYASGLAQQTTDEKDNRVLNLPTATGTSAIAVAASAPETPKPESAASPTGATATNDILSFDILNKLPGGGQKDGAATTPVASAAAPAPAPADKKSDGDAAISSKAEEIKKNSERAGKKRSFADWSVFVDQMNEVILKFLPLFTHSNFVEVQERAVTSLNFMQWLIGKTAEEAAAAAKQNAPAPEAGAAAGAAGSKPPETPEQNTARKQRLLGFVAHFVGLFGETLGVVGKKAQRAVPIPDGLDLDKEIHPGADKEVDDDDKEWGSAAGKSSKDEDDGYSLKVDEEDSKPKKLTAQEIEESKRRVAAGEARRAHDPFYIKSSATTKLTGGGSGGMSQAEVDKIPVKQLTDDDIGGSSVKVKKNGGKKSNSLDDEDAPAPTKTYTVLAVEDMPKGSKPEPKPAATGKKGSKKAAAAGDDSDGDVDLTTPLGADEFIPRTQTYAEKKAIADRERAEKEKSAQAEKDAKKKSKKKGSEKESKSKKHKHHSKEAGASGSAPPAAAAAPTATAAPPPAASGNVFDFFDPLASKKAAPAPAPTAPPPAPAPAKSSGGGDDDSKKSKKSGGSSKSGGKHSASDERLLHSHSDKYSVRFVVKHNTSASAPASGASALVLLNLKPKSSSVKAMELSFAHSRTVRVIGTSKDVSSDKGVTITLAKPVKNEVEKRMLQLDWSGGSLEFPAKLTVSITYVDSKDKKHKTESGAVELVIPAAVFVVPTKCSTDDFARLASSTDRKDLAAPVYTATASNVSVSSSVADALDLVPGALNVAQVEAAAFVAKFYGRIATGDRSHVLVLVKGKKDAPKSVAVEIKSNKQELSEQLLSELVAALK